MVTRSALASSTGSARASAWRTSAAVPAQVARASATAAGAYSTPIARFAPIPSATVEQLAAAAADVDHGLAGAQAGSRSAPS